MLCLVNISLTLQYALNFLMLNSIPCPVYDNSWQITHIKKQTEPLENPFHTCEFHLLFPNG